MARFALNSITVPRAVALAIGTWKERSFSKVMDDVEKNMSGRIMQSRSGAGLSNIKQQSGLEPMGFRLKTTMPYLIAWMRGSKRKAYFVAPKQALALSWVDKSGVRRFSKGHIIPAWTFQPKRPVFEDAIARNEAFMLKEFDRAMSLALSKLFPDTRLEWKI